MYSIFGYGKMITDSRRMDAYVQALQRVVKPGAVVLDIGTGTGIFALLACQLGARQVYALEPDNAIHVARKIALSNGYANQIEFIQQLSTQVTLPEPVDVIVSDLRGILPLFQNHIPAIIDARRRLLAFDGVLIPQRDTLWATVVSAPDLYSQYASPWNDDRYGVKMQAVQQLITNTWRKAVLTPAQFLVEPVCWAELDYTIVQNPHLKAELTWTVARAGTAHGLCVWFDATIIEGIGFSNAPGQPSLIYGNAFFPWSTPVSLVPGDRVSVTFQANLVNQDYIYSWHSQVFNQGDPADIKANFQQSTYFSYLLEPAQLRKQAADYVPSLGKEGKIDQFILTLMDGTMSLGEIANCVWERFPSDFAQWLEALNRVVKLSQQYVK